MRSMLQLRMKRSSWSSISINDSNLFQEAKVILELGLEAANEKSGWYRKVEFCQFSHEIVSRPIRVTQDQHHDRCLGIKMLGRCLVMEGEERETATLPRGKGVYFLLGVPNVPLSFQV